MQKYAQASNRNGVVENDTTLNKPDISGPSNFSQLVHRHRVRCHSPDNLTITWATSIAIMILGGQGADHRELLLTPPNFMFVTTTTTNNNERISRASFRVKHAQLR